MLPSCTSELGRDWTSARAAAGPRGGAVLGEAPSKLSCDTLHSLKSRVNRNMEGQVIASVLRNPGALYLYNIIGAVKRLHYLIVINHIVSVS